MQSEGDKHSIIGRSTGVPITPLGFNQSTPNFNSYGGYYQPPQGQVPEQDLQGGSMNNQVNSNGAPVSKKLAGQISNSNFRGRPENFIPGFGKKSLNNPKRTPRQGDKIPLIEQPQEIDFKAKLEAAKPWVKYDVREILVALEIPPTEEWLTYLEPFLVYLAQKLLVIAGKALKVRERKLAFQESTLSMTDEEFNEVLSQANFNPGRKASSNKRN